MALARVKVWGVEILTDGDLDAEFDNILNNALALISPLTGGLDCDGQTLTLDAAAVTTVVSSAAVAWNFTTGAKTGTPATTGSIANWSAQTFTDNATAGSGTAAAWVGFSVQRPTLAASNTLVTTTDAATWYIPNSPLAGTNQTITNAWALWVDAGNVRFDDDIVWLSGQTFAQRGILAHANTGIRTYTFPDASGTMFTTAGGTITGNVIISGATLQAATTIGVGAATPAASGAGITFPATVSLSSDANTLDDFEEATWTAELTFTTPGNLSVAYSQRTTNMVKIGSLVIVEFIIVTSTFTHTTASGNLRITGLPFTNVVSISDSGAGSVSWQGITKASYTHVAPVVIAGGTAMELNASGSGQAESKVTAADMPTGGTVQLKGYIIYRTNQ